MTATRGPDWPPEKKTPKTLPRALKSGWRSDIDQANAEACCRAYGHVEPLFHGWCVMCLRIVEEVGVPEEWTSDA